MRFIADVGVSPAIVAWLRAHGHDAVSLVETGQHRLADDEIYAFAAAERRIVITFDLNFAALAAVARREIASVVIFRLNNPRNAVAIRRLSEALPLVEQALSRGAVAIVEPSRIRLRALPIL